MPGNVTYHPYSLTKEIESLLTAVAEEVGANGRNNKKSSQIITEEVRVSLTALSRHLLAQALPRFMEREVVNKLVELTLELEHLKADLEESRQQLKTERAERSALSKKLREKIKV